MPISGGLPTKAIVTLYALSGTLRDAVQNEFCFANPSTSLDSSLARFYNTKATGAVSPTSTYLSPSLSRATTSGLMQFWDLTGHLNGSATGHPPYFQTTFALTGGGGTSLPSELASVLTIHADTTGIPEHGPGTRPKSRYRGRIYIGPLTTTVNAMDSTSKRAFVYAQYRNDLICQAQQLKADEPSWAVWSRVDAVLRPVTGGWIDDAWDVQRRRGEDPVVRTSWP